MKIKTLPSLFPSSNWATPNDQILLGYPLKMRPVKPLKTLSDLLDDYYRDKVERDRVQQQASELIRKVENDLEKNRKN